MKRRRAPSPARGEADKNLPVRRVANDILSALAANDVVIVVAETGSGKTTQLPQIIMEADSSAHIVVTQPRRVAAMTVAQRVANERKCCLGEEVGYAVRFDDKSTRGVTRLRYVTDGVLLREALGEGSSSLRKRYSHVIIDEVHERSVDTDIILGIIKEIISAPVSTSPVSPGGFASKNAMFAKMIRSKLPFKVIVMSATTEVPKFLRFFQDKTTLKVTTIDIPGRKHPVKIMNATEPVTDYVAGAATVARQVHIDSPLPGDILVFLPGQEEIMGAISTLKELIKHHGGKDKSTTLRILPLFASLSPADQMKAIEPLPEELQPSGRKIIFSTNVAETSVTIPGIKYVVDSGLVKVRGFQSDKGIFADVLRIQAVSVAEAEQRMGRAGRTGPGTLYRLYTEQEFNKMDPFPKPEILRVDASASLLQIIVIRNAAQKGKAMRNGGKEEQETSSFLTFPLIDRIPRKVVERALETLCILGAVDQTMTLTKTGKLMSRIPAGPMLARSLMESLRLGCVDWMLTLAAVLSAEGDVLLSPSTKREQAKSAHRRFISSSGDHITLVNALHAFLQLTGTSRRMEFCRDHFLNYRTLASAESIRNQLDQLLQHGDFVAWGLKNPLPATVESEVAEASMEELVSRCVVAGFFRNAARKRSEDGKYIPIGGAAGQAMETGVEIHPSSSLRALRVKRNPPLVVYNELVMTSKAYLRVVLSIEMEWLRQHCNSYFQKKELGS